MNIIRKWPILVWLILFPILSQATPLLTQAEAQTQIQTQEADEIAQKSFSLKSPTTIQMSVQIKLISSKGVARNRNVEVIQKNEPENVRFIHFTQPQDVAGTKFLSLKKEKKDGSSITETRIFTPSDKKIRAITSSSKKNAFMGSDLSYYDLEEHNYEDFSYSLIAKEQTIADKSFANRKFYTLRATPHDKSSPYSSMIYWIDSKTYQVRLIECLENGIKVKDIYILQNLKNTDYYIPKILLAVNYKKNGHKTVWQVEKAQINPTLAPRIFSIQNLN